MAMAAQSAPALTSLSSTTTGMILDPACCGFSQPCLPTARLNFAYSRQLSGQSHGDMLGLPAVHRQGFYSVPSKKSSCNGHRQMVATGDHDDSSSRQSFSSCKKGNPKKSSSRRHGEMAKTSKEAAAVPLRGLMPGPLGGAKGPPAVSLGAAFTSADELEAFRGLVLDISYRPINVVCWKRALCLDILQKADVLEYYDRMVQAPNSTFAIPAVLRVCNFVHSPKRHARRLSLSRNNIFLRDKFKCQYCGSAQNLTIDHVVATSRGGGWAWENLVTACSPCNLKKGDKSPEQAGMKLARLPKEPRELDASEMPSNFKTLRSLTRHTLTPSEWADYLPIKPPSL